MRRSEVRCYEFSCPRVGRRSLPKASASERRQASARRDGALEPQRAENSVKHVKPEDVAHQRGQVRKSYTIERPRTYMHRSKRKVAQKRREKQADSRATPVMLHVVAHAVADVHLAAVNARSVKAKASFCRPSIRDSPNGHMHRAKRCQPSRRLQQSDRFTSNCVSQEDASKAPFMNELLPKSVKHWALLCLFPQNP